MLPDHHPRTSLIAAKTSSGVQSTVKVAVTSLLVMIFVSFLKRGFVVVEARRGGTTGPNPSAQLRQSSLRPPQSTARPMGQGPFKAPGLAGPLRPGQR